MRAAVLLQEALNGLDARAVRGADEGNRMAEFVGQGQRVDDCRRATSIRSAIFSSTMVGRPRARIGAASMSWRLRLRASSTMRTAVGTRRAGHLAGQHIDGDTCIFGVGGKTVDAGQVDQREVVAADAAHAAGVLLHRHAGIVGDLLAQAGEPVEERGFAAVRRPDERNGAETAARLARLEGRLLEDSDGRRRRVTAHS